MTARPVPHPFAMRRRLSPTELFDSLDGVVVPGGCGDCRAVQRIARIPGYRHLTMITILHDPACRALARRGGGR